MFTEEVTIKFAQNMKKVTDKFVVAVLTFGNS